jgi:hypothetical protein
MKEDILFLTRLRQAILKQFLIMMSVFDGNP